MHTIHTFILRLLIDTDSPEELRGAIRSVASNLEYHFADAKTLLELLHQFCLNERTSESKLLQDSTKPDTSKTERD